MARRHKSKREPSEPAVVAPAPASIGSQLEHALRGAGLAKLPPRQPRGATASAAPKRPAPLKPTVPPPPAPPAPPAPKAPAPARPRSPYTAGELAALGDAYRGARPIKRKSPVLRRVGPRPVVPTVDATAIAEDQRARERLGALIAGDVRFDVQAERDGYVQALRQGAARKLLVAVQSSAFGPDATLDLHGVRAADAATRVHDFVRGEHRRGARRLLIVTGKGVHSELGESVLGPIAVEALTRGGAAPLVQAFSSAHAALGGRGALAVLLR